MVTLHNEGVGNIITALKTTQQKIIQKLHTLFSRFTQCSNINTEVLKYGITGVVHNGTGYLLYLLLTMLGAGHKSAMSFLYLIGTIINFIVNRKWTFRATGSVGVSFIRLLIASIIGYCLNIAGLFVLVDLAGWPHAWVQAGAIAIIAVYFFVINKYYVHAKQHNERAIRI